MNWSSVAIGLGHVMRILSRAPRPRGGEATPHRIRVGAFAASVVLGNG